MFQLLDTKVAQLDRAADRLKLLRNVLRITTLASSGLATIVLGLKGGWLPPAVAQDVALALTAGATFVGSLAAHWKVDDYWLRNKVMLNKLRHRLAFTTTEAPSWHQPAGTRFASSPISRSNNPRMPRPQRRASTRGRYACMRNSR